MHQFLRILSALNLLYAFVCFTILRWSDVAVGICFFVSLVLFFANVWYLKVASKDAIVFISNLVFNTISIAWMVWMWV